MPTPPVSPTTLRFRILGTLANLAPWGVRLYSLYTGTTPNNTVALAIAEAVASAWNTRIVPYQSNNVTTTQVIAEDLSSSSGAGATADVDYLGSGTHGAVANQVAAVVKMEIARRYRGGKPKVYVPGIDTGYTADDSHFTTGFANAFGTAWTNFNSDLNGIEESGTGLLGLWNVSYYHGFTNVLNPITGRERAVPTYRSSVLQDLVASFTVDELFGSQRRRRLG